MKQIYIIEDGSGNKKIGITENIERRVKQLKTAIPNGISTVLISSFTENALSIEKELHNANGAHRLSGEWFSEITDFCNISFSHFEFKANKINTHNPEIQALPELIEIHTSDLGNLFRLSAGTTGVLMCLVSMADYGGIIALNKYLKDSIAERMNAKPSKNGKPSNSIVNKAITELLNKEIITRIGSGTYQLNPNLFARGKWRDIYEQRKAFKVTITYSHDENGGKREIVTEQRDADVLQFPASKSTE